MTALYAAYYKPILETPIEKFIIYVCNVIIHRGLIPYMEMFFFCLAIIYLSIQYFARKREKRLFNEICEKWPEILSKLNNDSTNAITIQNSNKALVKIEKMDSKLRMSIAGKRLYQ